jgi:O-antigen/teichoic acid export membrane protein
MQMANPTEVEADLFSAEREPAWRSAVWLSFSQLVHSSGSFLALLLFTRWEGLQAAGEFSYALAVSAPVVQLLSLQLRALLLTHSREELPLESVLSLRVLSLPAVLLFAIVSFALASPLATIWLFIRTVDAWAELLQSEWQRLNRISTACWGNFIRTPLFLLCIFLNSDPGLSSLLYLLLSIVVLLLVDARGLRWRFNFHLAALRCWARRGAALGVVLFLYLTATNIPRIVLEHYVGPAALGCFAALFVFAQTGNLVASALGQSLLPLFSVSPPKRILAWLCLPALAAVICLPVLYQFDELLLGLLNIPVSPENCALIHTTAWCQCLIWPAAMSGYALTARRLYGALQKVGWGIVVVSAVVSLLLVPSAGPIGAAIALACQSGFLVGITIVLLVTGAGS